MKTKFTYDGEEFKYRAIQLQDDVAKAEYRNLFSESAMIVTNGDSNNIAQVQGLTLQDKLREAV